MPAIPNAFGFSLYAIAPTSAVIRTLIALETGLNL